MRRFALGAGRRQILSGTLVATSEDILIFDHVDWGQSCLHAVLSVAGRVCLYRCVELRRLWCGAPRCRVLECTVRSMVSKYACASHMRRGQLRMALRLLLWVAGRVFETFVAAQGESEMKSLAGHFIQEGGELRGRRSRRSWW